MCDAEGGQSVGLPAAASQREMMCEREVFDTFPLFVIFPWSSVTLQMGNTMVSGMYCMYHFCTLTPLSSCHQVLAGTELVGHTTHQV